MPIYNEGGGSNASEDINWLSGASSEVTDGASAVAYAYDTDATWTLGDLVTWSNNGTEVYNFSLANVRLFVDDSNNYIDISTGSFSTDFKPRYDFVINSVSGKFRVVNNRHTNMTTGGSLGADGLSWGRTATDITITPRPTQGANAADMYIQAQSASDGNNSGGDLHLEAGAKFGSGVVGNIILDNLPTSDPSITGALWNNSGVLTVS